MFYREVEVTWDMELLSTSTAAKNDSNTRPNSWNEHFKEFTTQTWMLQPHKDNQGFLGQANNWKNWLWLWAPFFIFFLFSKTAVCCISPTERISISWHLAVLSGCVRWIGQIGWSILRINRPALWQQRLCTHYQLKCCPVQHDQTGGWIQGKENASSLSRRIPLLEMTHLKWILQIFFFLCVCKQPLVNVAAIVGEKNGEW